MLADRSQTLGSLKKIPQESLGQWAHQADIAGNTQLFHPAQSLGLARHTRAQEGRQGELLEDEGNGLEESIIADAAGPETAPAIDPDKFADFRQAMGADFIGEVLDVMRGLAQSGMTMVIVTHEIAFARRVAHRVVVFEAGLIVESGTPEEVLERPRTAATRALLAMD